MNRTDSGLWSEKGYFEVHTTYCYRAVKPLNTLFSLAKVKAEQLATTIKIRFYIPNASLQPILVIGAATQENEPYPLSSQPHHSSYAFFTQAMLATARSHHSGVSLQVG
jgi:hypothetical protein